MKEKFPFFVEIMDSISKTFEMVNCSKIVGGMNLGHLLPNGSFDGALGDMISGVSYI